jgi:hypothetical protein
MGAKNGDLGAVLLLRVPNIMAHISVHLTVTLSATLQYYAQIKKNIRRSFSSHVLGNLKRSSAKSYFEEKFRLM